MFLGDWLEGTTEESVRQLMTGHFIEADAVKLHYLEFAGGAPTLVFLPGLSVTAPIFEALIVTGLGSEFHALAVDLRGRGLSGAPRSGLDPQRPSANYTMSDHAADILGLLDRLHVRRPVLVGHSFGGMLALFLAARHPEGVSRIVVIDAAIAVASPSTREVLAPMLARLGAVSPSWDAYLSAVKELPYFQDAWNQSIEKYFRNYVTIEPDGSVRQRVNPGAILAAVEGVLSEDWPRIVAAVRRPCLLINATGPYGPAGSAPFLPRAAALGTVEVMSDCCYRAVGGNHITMIFGDHAREVAEAIRPFVRGGPTRENEFRG
jgi:pimeloyl-ACP methyl ester carboxylesterase